MSNWDLLNARTPEADLRRQVRALRGALLKLANESGGFLALVEANDEARQCVGSTNITCLHNRIAEALEAILSAEPKAE